MFDWPLKTFFGIAGIAILTAIWLLADHRGYQRGAEDVRLEWGESKRIAAESALRLERENSLETARRYSAQQEIVSKKDREISAAHRDAIAAANAGLSLRSHINRLTSACLTGSDTGTSSSGETADSTGVLLSDVQRRLDEVAEGIARYADEASAAGRACERSYDALRKVEK